MNKKLLFFFAISFLLLRTEIKAQAYDGRIDRKLFLGYTNVGGNSGAEIKFEYGLNDLLSSGADFRYLFIETPPTTDQIEKSGNFFQKSDFGIFLNFHPLQTIKKSTKYDVYIGPYASLKSIGLQLGAKYNFTERIGVYINGIQSFGNSFFGIGGTPDDFTNNYGKKTYVSVGLSLNVY
jgi:hypothetical protein